MPKMSSQPPVLTARPVSDVRPVMGARDTTLEEVAHQIRQPLSVIESLAYYLELTSADEGTSAHLRRIQAMVLQANSILRNACAR